MRDGVVTRRIAQNIDHSRSTLPMHTRTHLYKNEKGCDITQLTSHNYDKSMMTSHDTTFLLS